MAVQRAPGKRSAGCSRVQRFCGTPAVSAALRPLEVVNLEIAVSGIGTARLLRRS